MKALVTWLCVFTILFFSLAVVSVFLSLFFRGYPSWLPFAIMLPFSIMVIWDTNRHGLRLR